MSHTQVGSLGAKNASEKFSRLGTFKVSQIDGKMVNLFHSVAREWDGDVEYSSE